MTMPPEMPLLAGTPTSKSHSPDLSYIPVEATTLSASRAMPASTTRSPVDGLTPPLVSVAPIMARSWASTRSAHCRV